MELVLDLLYILLWVAVGIVIGFFIAKKLFQKQLKDNPPINDKMIEAMMSGMGRKPSQKQLNQIKKQMTKYIK